MQEVSEEYSFGVICRYKDKYLVYKSSKTLWVFHKGHFEEQDTQIVTPYDDVELVPLNKTYQYPAYITKKAGAAIIAGIRELMEQSGFVLPSESLKLKLKQKYHEQGKLLFVKDEKVLCVQQPVYQFSKKNKTVRKYVTYFFAELFQNIPVASHPKNMKMFTKQEFLKLKQSNNLRQTALEYINKFEELLEKEQ